jgi:hypothetical protein
MPRDFWNWLNTVTTEALATDVGQRMQAEGFTVTHTGGGCLAWERTLSHGRYVWITDDDAGLGVDGQSEYFAVGAYDAEGNFKDDEQNSFLTLDEALAAARELATKVDGDAFPTDDMILSTFKHVTDEEPHEDHYIRESYIGETPAWMLEVHGSHWDLFRAEPGSSEWIRVGEKLTLIQAYKLMYP